MKSLKRFDYLIYTSAFVVISLFWSHLSNFTWDDDAITRMMRLLDAHDHPEQFLSSWNRPLFILLFYLPAQLFGKTGVMTQMVILTAFSGILLYKGLKHKGVPHSSAVIVFLLFQTFLFGIARDAMTEPLASFFTCLGIYFLYKEKFYWFALVGGLLPLARSEAILLMPFWLYPLIQYRKYRCIPLLAVGMGTWALGWYIYSGQPLALVKELLSSGNTKNRYEHVGLTHHTGKYVYVLGPVIFFFFLGGYLGNLKKLLSDYFILLQFTIGFLIYIIFATYLDLGQSGGALRNLVTLSPFAAVICLYGFNYWTTLFILPIPKKAPGKPQPLTATNNREMTMLWLFVAFILIIAWFFFTNELILRQDYHPVKKDYTVFLFLSICCLLAILPCFSFIRANVYVVMEALFLCQITFTLHYENPQSHGNEERKGMNDMTVFIQNTTLRHHKVYCNHPWYFWAANIRPTDTSRIGAVVPGNNLNIKPGELVIWEPRYTSVYYTNVPITTFQNDTTFTPIYVTQNSKNEVISVLFMKLYPQLEEDDLIFNELVTALPQDAWVLHLKGIYERDRKKNPFASLQDFTAALSLSPERGDTYLNRGISYLMLNDLKNSCQDLNRATVLGEQQAIQLLQTYCR